MKQEVNKLLLKIGLFIIPVLCWVSIVIVVDPFNYFNISKIISYNIKVKSAQQINSLLFNTINFKNKPTSNIIIGDSRIRKLPTKKIKKITGKKYHIMHSNAAKLNEIIDLFWYSDSIYFAATSKNLKNVIIGINFNLYNQYSYANRVEEVEAMLRNKYLYFFNWSTLETVYLTLKNQFFKYNVKEKKIKQEHWEYITKTIARNHYSKYKYPENTLKRLKEIGNYCSLKNINLTLLIVPHHKDFHDRLIEYNLEKAELVFKNDIKDIGRVIDYDFPNSITGCTSCFTDPIHTTDSVSNLIIEEILLNKFEIGNEL